MAYRTVESLILDAILKGLKLSDSNAITTEMLKRAVVAYNASEPFIWRKWPWHNRKIDEIEVTPDANGIIVFDGTNSDVDMVRAVRGVDTTSTSDDPYTPMFWNQSDIRAAIDGKDVNSETFQNLSDDSDGYRRIKVSLDDEDITTFKVLAFRRFVQAEVNDSYSEGDPSATPYDYRVLTWKIDRANAAMIDYIADEMREWMSKDAEGKWTHSLNGTIKDIREQEQTEHLLTPDCGKFGEMGDWY